MRNVHVWLTESQHAPFWSSGAAGHVRPSVPHGTPTPPLPLSSPPAAAHASGDTSVQMPALDAL